MKNKIYVHIVIACAFPPCSVHKKIVHTVWGDAWSQDYCCEINYKYYTTHFVKK